MQAQVKSELVKQLQAKINAIQRIGNQCANPAMLPLEPFAAAFPDHVFPVSAIHEFVSYEAADSASTIGFISALAGKFMTANSLCLWICNERKIFPSALKHFGLEPDRIIFIHTPKPREALWTIEEALKCEAVTAVVGEIKELGFTESRRLQLAVENSGVTGFIHRHRPFRENAVACTTRWKVTPLPGIIPDGLPGVGHSCWDIQLLKVRNGRPDSWKISWSSNTFRMLENHELSISQLPTLQTG